MPSRLTAAVVSPEDSPWGVVELRLLVDGLDVLEFDAGPWHGPDRLLPLLAAGEPREVMLAEAECTVGCCGAVFVRVRREGDEVVWDRWRNPGEADLSLPEFRFDAGQYAVELARADRDRSWEWPGRTVARLVRAKLAESKVLDRWDSDLDFATSFPHARDRIEVYFASPPRTGELVAHKQFVLRFGVTDAPVGEQADAIVAMLTAGDPRRTAEVCGGYDPA